MVSYEIGVLEMSTKRNTTKTQTLLEQDGISICRVFFTSKRNFYHMYFENIFQSQVLPITVIKWENNSILRGSSEPKVPS